MTPIRFGTDGWRAVIADEFTFANVERVAQAAAAFWLKHPPPGAEPKAIVGYDRRFLSDQFARRTAEVLAGNGFVQSIAVFAAALSVARMSTVTGCRQANCPCFSSAKTVR